MRTAGAKPRQAFAYRLFESDRCWRHIHTYRLQVVAVHSRDRQQMGDVFLRHGKLAVEIAWMDRLFAQDGGGTGNEEGRARGALAEGCPGEAGRERTKPAGVSHRRSLCAIWIARPASPRRVRAPRVRRPQFQRPKRPALQ